MGFFKKLFGGPQFESAESIKSKVKKGALVLDVRTEPEYASGHITGALNIPLQLINEMAGDLKKQKKSGSGILQKWQKKSNGYEPAQA